MSNGLNGSGDSAAPVYAELTTAWHARVKERQQSELTQAEAVEVELPGGTPVYALKANVISLLEAGRIPDALTPFVLDLLKAGREQGDVAVTKLLVDGFADWVRLMDAIWLVCVVQPKFVADGTLSDDAIPMRLVDLEDKIAFFNWAQGVPDHLDAFRQSRDDARASPDGEGIRTASGADVGSGPTEGTVTRLPTDASNVLRRTGGRKPSAAETHRMDSDRADVQGHEPASSAGVDLRRSRRARDRAS